MLCGIELSCVLLTVLVHSYDFCNVQYFCSCATAAGEIQLSFERPVNEIFNMSKDVMATQGEWDFIDMRALKHEFVDFEGTTRDQIKYYVSSLYSLKSINEELHVMDVTKHQLAKYYLKILYQVSCIHKG